MTSRDEVLANFQVCAGIEDVGEALTRLESCNWDFTEALNSVIPDHTMLDVPMPPVVDLPRIIPNIIPSTIISSLVSGQPELIEIDDPPIEPPSLLDLSASVASTSSATTSQAAAEVPSTLDINIQVMSATTLNEHNSFPLEVAASTTVGELQSTLHQLVGVPACQQVLEGFEETVQPETIITADLLPKNKTLVLNAGTIPSFSNYYEKMNGIHKEDYHLLIHDENGKQDYSLHYPASKLIKELKSDIFHLTNIAVRHQIWTGWPPNLDENAALWNSGISKEHHLTVSKLSAAESTSRRQKKVVVESAAEDSSGDEFEDASDLLPEDFIDMVDMPRRQRPQSLIPANAVDEETGVDQFCNNFRVRFGNNIPIFYNGQLEEALKDSVMLPAKMRRLLAVYLHHDSSILSNVFCSEALCQPSVAEFLNENYIVWGWDLTQESNKARLLNLVSSHFGTMASATIRGFSIDKLPALLIITRIRGIVEIISVVHGNAVLDEVLTTLLHAVDLFDGQRRSDVMEEDAREEREAMKAEQDAAYHESLQADRAKAVAKRTAEREERVERERQESLREQEEAIKLAVRASLESQLPEEPSSDCLEPTTKFRFRTPNKEFFSRTFLMSNQLQVVLNYLCVKGYAADEFKCIQAWPRRDITTLNPSQTLKQHNMPAQESLTIEER